MPTLNDNKTKQALLQKIEQELGSIDFGSIQIYVQDKTVTQISVVKTEKTSIDINQPQVVAPTNKTFTIQAHFRRSE